MTQFVSLILPDSTPTDKTFAVGSINYGQNLATWILSGASFDASTFLSLSFKPASSNVARTKVRARLVLPIMDAVNTTKKVDEIILEISASIPKTATLQQRKDARVFLRGLQSQSVWTNAIDSFEGVY